MFIQDITQQADALTFSTFWFSKDFSSISICSWSLSGLRFVESNKKSKALEHIVFWEDIEAAKKSTSSSSKCSIPGVIFLAALIQLFLALSADKYLKEGVNYEKHSEGISKFSDLTWNQLRPIWEALIAIY